MASGDAVHRGHVEGLKESAGRVEPLITSGRITKVVGLLIEARGPSMSVGELCHIKPRGLDSTELVPAEAVGFRDDSVLLMPYRQTLGLTQGDAVYPTGKPLSVPVHPDMLGRVLDGLGEPMDDKGPLRVERHRAVHARPGNPIKRPLIKKALQTGIKAIDATCTVGLGQRIGIFSGTGIGKSVMMGMIARFTNADVNVIALVGERIREVREFIEKDLGPDGLKRSVVIAATSNQPPLIRLNAALVATTIAEYFRERGKNVLLMMDSITRAAQAQRDVGNAIGEPPSTRGYTPSVFSLIPNLMERAGTSDSGGSITGLYNVLVEGDDLNEPISDTARGVLDGHIVLSRKLAERGHYPAVDVLASLSRVMPDVTEEKHAQLAMRLRETLAAYKESETLIEVGAYVQGTNPKTDYAITMIEKINSFLKQGMNEQVRHEETMQRLEQLFG